MIYNKLSLFLFVVVLASLVCCNQKQKPDPDFHVYLCFGQSNMEGQGSISPEDTVTNDRFLTMQALDCPQREREKEKWYKAQPPICQCHSGLSPLYTFGMSLVQHQPNIKVGVVSVAVGGCDIRLFDKDIYEEYDSTYMESWFQDKVKNYGGNPYQHLLSLAKSTQKDGVIKGVLLHQGETNTGDEQWPLYVKKVYNDLLTDLHLDSHAVPLVAGEVVSADTSCCASMNTIIHTLPQYVKTAHIIESDGCTIKDNAHFDAAGYREMGRRYAEKILSLSN